MPVHEGMEPSRFPDQILAGTKMQMVGIGEQDFGSDLLHFPGRHRLDAGRRAHRHIDRRGNIPVRGMQHPQTGSGLPADMGYLITE